LFLIFCQSLSLSNILSERFGSKWCAKQIKKIEAKRLDAIFLGQPWWAGLSQGSNLATENPNFFLCFFYIYILYIFSPPIFFLLCKYFFYFSIHNFINSFPFFCTQFHKFYLFSCQNLYRERNTVNQVPFFKPSKTPHDTCFTTFNFIFEKTQPLALLVRTIILENVSYWNFL
jgi:hypothetical protein